MTDVFNRAVCVRRRARGIPVPEDFEIIQQPMPLCPQGGVLVRVLLATVDPGMRGWLSAETNYLTVPDGAVMRAQGVGEIVESDCADWPVGGKVFGWLGWQQFAAVMPEDLSWRIDVDVAPLECWLSLFGLNGLTAWVGLNHFGRLRAGETILVTTAAGGVGGIVGQLAKAAGLRCVGLTGGPDKVERAKTEFRYDAAIDYRAACDLAKEISAACPNGIDIFFDSTGGALADAVFPVLNTGARIIQCGTASVETWLPPPSGPRRERDMLVKRLSWHGFVVMDHADLFPVALGDLRALYAQGRLVSRDEILDGIEHAPGAIGRLYRGENQGRLTIRP
jgi:NADPH-dependent curcumin reductase CurA